MHRPWSFLWGALLGGALLLAPPSGVQEALQAPRGLLSSSSSDSPLGAAPGAGGFGRGRRSPALLAAATVLAHPEEAPPEVPDVRTLIYVDSLNAQLEAVLTNGFGEVNLFGFGNGGSGFGIYVLMSPNAVFTIRPKSNGGGGYYSDSGDKENQLGDNVFVVNDLLAFDVKMTSLATGAVFASQVQMNFEGEGVGLVSKFSELDLGPSLSFTLAVVPIPTTGDVIRFRNAGSHAVAFFLDNIVVLVGGGIPMPMPVPSPLEQGGMIIISDMEAALKGTVAFDQSGEEIDADPPVFKASENIILGRPAGSLVVGVMSGATTAINMAVQNNDLFFPSGGTIELVLAIANDLPIGQDGDLDELQASAGSKSDDFDDFDFTNADDLVNGKKKRRALLEDYAYGGDPCDYGNAYYAYYNCAPNPVPLPLPVDMPSGEPPDTEAPAPPVPDEAVVLTFDISSGTTLEDGQVQFRFRADPDEDDQEIFFTLFSFTVDVDSK